MRAPILSKDVPGFKRFREQLAADGFQIVGGEEHPEVFGSWSIMVSDDPLMRVSRDAKDRWLIVQRASGQRWTDLWTAKEPESQTPAAAVEALRRL